MSSVTTEVIVRSNVGVTFLLSTLLRYVGRVEVWRLTLLVSALHVGELSASRHGRFALRKGTFCTMGI